MLPPTPTPPVTITAPLVELVEAVEEVNVVAPFEVKVVNAPVDLVEAPIVVLLIEPPVIVAPSMVLLVNVSVPAKVATVPVVGNVMLVLAVVVSVKV
jgi:hypothetical protein